MFHWVQNRTQVQYPISAYVSTKYIALIEYCGRTKE